MDDKLNSVDGDVEKNVVGPPAYSEESDINVNPPLKRQLKNRHIAMIRFVLLINATINNSLLVLCSIGGVIGTGLFLGTANALRHGGPIGLLLGYLIVGSITYAVMVCDNDACIFYYLLTSSLVDLSW